MIINNVQTIAISFLSFIFGTIFGYFVRGYWDKNLSKPVGDYRNAVLISVTFVWVTSVLYEILNPAYQTNPLIHGLLAGIVGFFFKKDGNNDK